MNFDFSKGICIIVYILQIYQTVYTIDACNFCAETNFRTYEIYPINSYSLFQNLRRRKNIIKMEVKIQGDQLNMAVYFWYFVTSTSTTVQCGTMKKEFENYSN